MHETLRIGIVVPRYGINIHGGAETLARAYTGALTAMGHTVEVVTTTAVSANTWIPTLPEGSLVEDGIAVHRFDTVPRNWGRYDAMIKRLERQGQITIGEAHQLIRELGYSPGLLDYLDAKRGSMDWWIFLPYLFSPIVEGLPRVSRSILVPCLHDEPIARIPPVGKIFRDATRIWYNTAEEAQLGQALWNRPGSVVGLGFDPPDITVEECAAIRKPLALPPRYLLYLGRFENGKGLLELFQWYQAYRKRLSGLEDPMPLVAAGDGSLGDDIPEGVIVYHNVDTRIKSALYAGAFLFCMPSIAESLSMVMMESWLRRVPILARAGSSVTSAHIRRSGGGLIIRDSRDFTAAVVGLERNRELRLRMGEGGYDYVRREYNWPHIARKMADGLAPMTRLGGFHAD